MVEGCCAGCVCVLGVGCSEEPHKAGQRHTRGLVMTQTPTRHREASEEMELGMTSEVGKGGRGGKSGHQEGTAG